MPEADESLYVELFKSRGLGIGMTCFSCPEQYDVTDLKEGHYVGYIRLRGGNYRVEFPCCAYGHEIYAKHFAGEENEYKGEFSDDAERLRYLTIACSRILFKLAQVKSLAPDDDKDRAENRLGLCFENDTVNCILTGSEPDIIAAERKIKTLMSGAKSGIKCRKAEILRFGAGKAALFLLADWCFPGFDAESIRFDGVNSHYAHIREGVVCEFSDSRGTLFEGLRKSIADGSGKADAYWHNDFPMSFMENYCFAPFDFSFGTVYAKSALSAFFSCAYGNLSLKDDDFDGLPEFLKPYDDCVGSLRQDLPFDDGDIIGEVRECARGFSDGFINHGVNDMRQAVIDAESEKLRRSVDKFRSRFVDCGAFPPSHFDFDYGLYPEIAASRKDFLIGRRGCLVDEEENPDAIVLHRAKDSAFGDDGVLRVPDGVTRISPLAFFGSCAYKVKRLILPGTFGRDIGVWLLECFPRLERIEVESDDEFHIVNDDLILNGFRRFMDVRRREE